jgi:hypothetical protein
MATRTAGEGDAVALPNDAKLAIGRVVIAGRVVGRGRRGSHLGVPSGKG